MGKTYFGLKPQYRVVAKIGDRQVIQADIQKSVIHTFAYTDSIKLLKHCRGRRWLMFQYGAICAGQQNRFWELASALFEHQKELTSDENGFDYARVLGINSKQLAACMDSEAVKKSVAFDIQLAYEWFITVTPAVFINQQYYPGVPAIDLIDRYLPRHRY